jgi:hypothetical protein
MIVGQSTPAEGGADLVEGLMRIGPNMPVILYVDHVDRALLMKAGGARNRLFGDSESE